MRKNAKSQYRHRLIEAVDKELLPATYQSDTPLQVRALTNAEGGCTVLVTRPGASLDTALSIPLTLLASGKHVQLDMFLLDRG